VSEVEILSLSKAATGGVRSVSEQVKDEVEFGVSRLERCKGDQSTAVFDDFASLFLPIVGAVLGPAIVRARVLVSSETRHRWNEAAREREHERANSQNLGSVEMWVQTR
jgi:hypothetical protein